jgi:hypothetical protein
MDQDFVRAQYLDALLTRHLVTTEQMDGTVRVTALF